MSSASVVVVFRGEKALIIPYIVENKAIANKKKKMTFIVRFILTDFLKIAITANMPPIMPGNGAKIGLSKISHNNPAEISRIRAVMVKIIDLPSVLIQFVL